MHRPIIRVSALTRNVFVSIRYRVLILLRARRIIQMFAHGHQHNYSPLEINIVTNETLKQLIHMRHVKTMYFYEHTFWNIQGEESIRLWVNPGIRIWYISRRNGTCLCKREPRSHFKTLFREIVFQELFCVSVRIKSKTEVILMRKGRNYHVSSIIFRKLSSGIAESDCLDR